MNNFDRGLAVLKKHCRDSKTISGDEVFRGIAEEMEIPMDRLHFYLDCMQHLELINYSQQDKTISITEKGAKTKKLFG